jgi:AraC-like DNA-binding protein
LPEIRGVVGLFDASPKPAVVHGGLHRSVVAELHALSDSSGLERLGRALALLGRIAVAAEDVSWMAAASRPAAPEQRDARLGRVMGWIHRSYAQPLSVADAAGRLSVAPTSFSRAFHRRVGRPFTVYVNDVRVAEACLMLRQSQRTIAEIAQRCGFPTLGHFHRQFAKRTGLGPRAYRRAFGRRP